MWHGVCLVCGMCGMWCIGMCECVFLGSVGCGGYGVCVVGEGVMGCGVGRVEWR